MTKPTATVTVYNAGPQKFTGPIRKRYPLGLTIENERGCIWYATFDRVTEHAQPSPPQDMSESWQRQAPLWGT